MKWIDFDGIVTVITNVQRLIFDYEPKLSGTLVFGYVTMLPTTISFANKKVIYNEAHKYQRIYCI